MSFSLHFPAGTTIEFDGESYTFRQEFGNGFLEFMNTRTGAPLQVPDLETGGWKLPDEDWLEQMRIEERVVIRSAKTDTAVRQAARAQQYSPDEIQALDGKAALRHFICTTADKAGVKRGLKAVGKFLEEVFQETDVIAKFGEVPPNASTVLDWLRQRGSPGDRRFADMRQMTGLMGPGKIQYELQEPVFQRALSYSTNRGRKISDVYADHVRDVEKMNLEREPDQQLTAVSYETFRRRVRLIENRKTFAAKYGKQFMKSRWMGGGQPLTSSRILEIAMFDHTPIDMIFCVDAARGVIAGHPQLGIMVDHLSRCILHREVGFGDPTMCDIGRALLGANRPKDVPPYYAERYPVAKKVYGKPDEVYFDNALYQVARGVEDAYADVGVDVCYVGVREPTHKAVVERLMKIIKEMLVEKLPGSTYDIPSMREAGYNPEEHVAMTITEFRVLLDEAIALYHITPHSGLGGRPPLAVWERGLKQARNIIPDDQQDQLRRAIGNVVYGVTLTKDGIEHFGGLKFTDRETTPQLLDDLACLEARRKRPKAAKAVVKIKYDDQDISKIEVFNERTKTYVSLFCTNPDYADGMPLWMHERIRENTKQEARAFNTKAEQLAAKSRFNDLILEFCPEMAQREAKMLAKLADDPELRRKGGVDVLLQPALPSSTGMETEIPNDMPSKTRVDSTYRSPRPARGAAKPARDPRDAGKARKSGAKAPTVSKDRRDAGKVSDTPATPARSKRALGWS